jgi:hypothetical protein
MSTRKLVVFITFLAIFAMAARISVDTDTWWHLRAGQWMLENRQIPQVDPFSYTRGGEPWQYPGWLVELPMIALYRLGGPGLLNLWTAAIVTLAFVFIWFTLSGNAFLRAFSLILAATVSAVYWAARPYLVTFLLAAVFLWALEDYRWRSRDHLWWLPVLMIVWVNSHGGFIAGFLIWGVYTFYALLTWTLGRLGISESSPAGGRRLLRLLVIGGTMLAAVLINPSGAAMVPYAFKTVRIGALQDFIQEWQTPNFHLLHVQPFAWLLLLTFGVVGASRRRIALTDFLLFAGFAYMGLLAGRNVALFALAAPIVLTRHADPLLAAIGRKIGYRTRTPATTTGRTALLNWILLVLVLLAALIKAGTVVPSVVNQKAFRESLPVGAVEYLRTANLPGKLFNSYNWGGYLLWALPEYPVFIDGRTDLYDDEVISEWLQVVRAEPGWQDILDRRNVRLVILEPGYPLVIRLEAEGWKSVYQDDNSVIYAR